MNTATLIAKRKRQAGKDEEECGLLVPRTHLGPFHSPPHYAAHVHIRTTCPWCPNSAATGGVG